MECKDGKESVLKRCELSCDYDKDANPFCLTSDGGKGRPDCEWYQSAYSKDICGLKCQLGLESSTREEGCKTASWTIWAVVIGIILLILLIWIYPKLRILKKLRQSSKRQAYY